MAIRNPTLWSAEGLRPVGGAIRGIGGALQPTGHAAAPLAVRRIGYGDLGLALRRGFDDFTTSRSDILFACLVYPLAGLVLARLALGYDLMPLVFPLASGFALIGPFAAAGLYAVSRARERGEEPSLGRALSVFSNPSIGSILRLGLVLLALFAAWIVAALLIYNATLGPEAPVSWSAFIGDVFGTSAGWALIVIGCGVGFLFALAALAISAVSFPLLVDREVGARAAMRTSLEAMRVNPGPMLAWGAIVAGLLVLGAVPLLWGLIIVMPVLGHATWHLYRRVVADDPSFAP
jgi:uncharacterized membrane protein